MLKEGTTLMSFSGYILSILHTSGVASLYCFDHYLVEKATETGAELFRPVLWNSFINVCLIVWADTGILRDCIVSLRIFPTTHYICLPKEYSLPALRMLLFINAAFNLTSICKYDILSIPMKDLLYYNFFWVLYIY